MEILEQMSSYDRMNYETRHMSSDAFVRSLRMLGKSRPVQEFSRTVEYSMTCKHFVTFLMA